MHAAGALISGWMTALVTQSTLGRMPAPKPEGLIWPTHGWTQHRWKSFKTKDKQRETLKKRPLSNILPLNLYYIDIYSIQRWKNKPKTSCLTCFEMFVSATRLCVTYCKKTIVLPKHTNTNCQWSIALHSPHPVSVCLSPFYLQSVQLVLMMGPWMEN